MHLVECTPAGTVFRVDADIVKSCQPAIHLRIGLEDQAAFWALAYLSVKSSSTVARPTAVSFSIDDQRHITSMLEFFRGMMDLSSAQGMAGQTATMEMRHLVTLYQAQDARLRMDPLVRDGERGWGGS
ncbi:hypothetical protein C8R43DRAFT_1132418 [Mycena crocata]|nr:hypothetical protein C8R43DRAFT_1132418 [Mycena crocata]